jgi:hypothetical protein
MAARPVDAGRLCGSLIGGRHFRNFLRVCLFALPAGRGAAVFTLPFFRFGLKEWLDAVRFVGRSNCAKQSSGKEDEL